MKKPLIVTIIIVVLALAGYLFYTEGTLPVNKSDLTPNLFVISPGEPLDSIINKLSSEGLIRNRLVFYLIVKQKGIETQIQAGDFRLNPSMNAYELADELTHGTIDVWITIKEGLRKEEIAEILSHEFDLSEAEFNGLTREGYLFPDTYLIPKDPTSQQIIDITTKNFDSKYTSEIDEKITAKGLTKNEAITMASLVEREATVNDRQGVANIIYKRYVNDWPLEIDATVQYALGYQPAQKTWWKKDVTQEEYRSVRSPYNTYLNVGLPPEPIANPGLASIEAVANADKNTPYWYYFHDQDGNIFYSKTLEEHVKNSTN
ncbi:hypothetical protein A2861_00465 [Candidatus Roizmanbacteria bacterium RIFCSPHIGHO2_01_FULL_38_15]|nr:MAG: hypothetical protein A2861_00465 [Candidatus Roizmanbacteria bacterium RIFCSPHIGHO2_01_FULL_38_15]